MTQERTPHCYYVDHSFHSAREIGGIYSKLSGMYSPEELGGCIVLATCQRIEAYTLSEGNPFAGLGLPFRHLAGLEAVRKRIVAIGAGVESQILGERNVYHQVRNAFRDADDGNALKGLFTEALQGAQAIRRARGFYADMNYEDISLAILQDVLGRTGVDAVGLVIVGSGMLARNFLEKDILSVYNGVKFLTRSPRNLKKKFDKELKMSVMRCSDFRANESEEYHCIIATNGIDVGGYSEDVRQVLLSDSCKAVFDLSAAPLFRDELNAKFYVDTYSNIYYDYVDRYNSTKIAESQRIRNEIMNGVPALV
jgi:glutamyl-tRNA reductase